MGLTGLTGLTTTSFDQPERLAGRDPAALYVRSYLLVRTVVGVLGVALPTVLILADWLLLGGEVELRGSLSAYYHSPARDLFVGTLFVVGVLLMTYLAGQRDTWDFWLSLVAGVAALGVALLPTPRPGLPDAARRCGEAPRPRGCSAVQQALGETATGVLHFVSAGVFILCLAAMCFVFAHRAVRFDGAVAVAGLLRGCGVVILLAVAWAGFGSLAGIEVDGLDALYLGEVVAVYAFGFCWFVTGRRLWVRLVPPSLVPRSSVRG